MKKHEDLLQEVCALLKTGMNALESPHAFDGESQHGLAMLMCDCYARLKIATNVSDVEDVDDLPDWRNRVITTFHGEESAEVVG